MEHLGAPLLFVELPTAAVGGGGGGGGVDAAGARGAIRCLEVELDETVVLVAWFLVLLV